jgi:hypothetical protein
VHPTAKLQKKLTKEFKGSLQEVMFTITATQILELLIPLKMID